LGLTYATTLRARSDLDGDPWKAPPVRKKLVKRPSAVLISPRNPIRLTSATARRGGFGDGYGKE